jgi:hypothetical protein
VVIVECSSINGECCEAANKFMRQVRASDGYSVYSDIIERKVAVIGLGAAGKVAGGKPEGIRPCICFGFHVLERLRPRC